MQHVVFDDPAIRPVRADHAPLLRGRRRPISSGLRHFKATHGDVVDMVAGREEACATNTDLHQFLIRIGTLEIRPDRKISTAMKWLISYSRKRNEKSMAQKLAGEIIAAAKEEGSAVKKRQDTHKMAEANKAFSHFRF